VNRFEQVDGPDVDEAGRDEPPPAAGQQLGAADRAELEQHGRLAVAQVSQPRHAEPPGDDEAVSEPGEAHQDQRRRDDGRARVQEGLARHQAAVVQAQARQRLGADPAQGRVGGRVEGDAAAGAGDPLAGRREPVALAAAGDPVGHRDEFGEAQEPQRLLEGVARDAGGRGRRRREPQLRGRLGAPADHVGRGDRRGARTRRRVRQGGRVHPGIMRPPRVEG